MAKITRTHICQNPNCGKEFPHTQSANKYCSPKCSSVGCSILYLERGKIQRKNKEENYLNNPKLCLNCNTIISFHKKENKFCSQSCSASYTNKLWTLEMRQKQAETLIKTVGKSYDNIRFYEDYRRFCSFRIKKEDYYKIKNYDLYLKYGIYNTRKKDKIGCHLDHIYSVNDGFNNNINPKIISHIENCQFLLSNVNSSKGSRSDISLEKLLENISKSENLLIDVDIYIEIDKIKFYRRRKLKSNKIKPDGPYCKINWSPITGIAYNTKLKPALGWNNPHKVSAKILAKMFNFELGIPYKSEKNILSSIQVLKDLVYNQKLKPIEIQKLYNVKYSCFNMFLKNIGI